MWYVVSTPVDAWAAVGAAGPSAHVPFVILKIFYAF
jgi:hypothetical protein